MQWYELRCKNLTIFIAQMPYAQYDGNNNKGVSTVSDEVHNVIFKLSENTENKMKIKKFRKWL